LSNLLLDQVSLNKGIDNRFIASRVASKGRLDRALFPNIAEGDDKAIVDDRDDSIQYLPIDNWRQ